MSHRGDAPNSSATERLGLIELLIRFNKPIVAAVTILIFALVGIAIYHLTSEVHYADVVDAFTQTSWADVALAALFTALSFFALILYDVNALHYIGRRLPLSNVALTAFSAYAVGNTAGFGALSGGAIRYRAYARAGLAPEDIARVIAFVTLAFGLGLAAVSSLSSLIIADEVAPLFGLNATLLRIIAAIVAAVLCVLAFLGRKGHEISISRLTIRLPDVRTSLTQLLITTFDIAASGAVLYVLLPDDATISLPVFLAIYAIAIGLGVLSHIPAGLGIFETVIIAAVGKTTGVEAVLGSLVLYRIIYHILPLLLATTIVTLTELWHLSHHPVASRVWRVGARLSPALLATLSLILGAMLIFSSVLPTPSENLDILSIYIPLPFLEGAHLLSSLTGLVLVVAARGLSRRLDGAWWVALITACLALIFSLMKAIALFEAALLVFFILSLGASRRVFSRPASLLNLPFSSVWTAALATVFLSAIVLLLFVYRDVDYSLDLWWQFEFDAEVPRSVRAILGLTIACTSFTIYSLLKPTASFTGYPTRNAIDDAVVLTEQQPVADANLVRMGDKRLLFSNSRDAFIMYGVQGRSWIALFDPIGERKAFSELVWQFVERAREAGCRPVFYQISPLLLSACADAGLRAFKLGELARVDLRGFDLKAGKWASLRQSGTRAARDGLEFSVVAAADVNHIVEELSEVSDAWLDHHKTKEKGFSLGAFEPDYICSQPVAVLRMAGKIVAFSNILMTDLHEEGSVDLMRFSPDAPKGSMDFLFIKIMEYLRETGFAYFNLGMAPLSGMSQRSVAPVWDRIGGIMYEHGDRFYNFKGLRAFKSKFHPDWEPRYLAVTGGLNPAIAVLDSTLLIGGGLRGVVGR